MTPHPSGPGPAGDENRPPADSSASDATGPLPANAAPTLPLPPHAAAGSHWIPEAGQKHPSGTGSSTGHSAGSGPGPVEGPGGFFSWLRSLGIVRGTDRWAGGVCSGLGARLGVDPVLVRGLFVVLALFGVGLLLYGLAWAFLPEPDGRIHAEEALHGTWTSGTTGALTATLCGTGPSLLWADDGWFGGLFWPLFWVVGLGLLVYWLTTRSSPATVKRNAATDTALGHRDAGQGTAGPDTAGPNQAPPPYGYAAPHAYPAKPVPGLAYPDRPAPAPVPARPRTTPTGSQIALVLGAVLLSLGTVLALDYAGLIDLESPVAAALAAAAVVNGLGIVVLGALGRSSGILGLTAVLALVGAGLAGSYLGTYTNVVVANQATWTPNRSNPATEGYTLAAVDGQLDLRYLAGESTTGIVVPVSVAASDLTILVPDDIPVLIRTDMLAGNVEIDDGVSVTESGSIWRSADQRLNDADGEPVVVHVKGVASNVLVTVDESDLDR